jgi:hypothetical protein
MLDSADVEAALRALAGFSAVKVGTDPGNGTTATTENRADTLPDDLTGFETVLDNGNVVDPDTRSSRCGAATPDREEQGRTWSLPPRGPMTAGVWPRTPTSCTRHSATTEPRWKAR